MISSGSKSIPRVYLKLVLRTKKSNFWVLKLFAVRGLLIDKDGKGFCNELRRCDYVTELMWRNEPPFRLILNKKASQEITSRFQEKRQVKHFTTTWFRDPLLRMKKFTSPSLPPWVESRSTKKDRLSAKSQKARNLYRDSMEQEEYLFYM